MRIEFCLDKVTGKLNEDFGCWYTKNSAKIVSTHVVCVNSDEHLVTHLRRNRPELDVMPANVTLLVKTSPMLNLVITAPHIRGSA